MYMAVLWYSEETLNNLYSTTMITWCAEIYIGNDSKTEWNDEIEIHTVVYSSQVLKWAHHYCYCVFHLEYANSLQCICLLVLDLPLGGHSPTQLLSLSAVCLKTPVFLPHAITLHQSHLSASNMPHVWSQTVGPRWDVLRKGGASFERGTCSVLLYKTKAFIEKTFPEHFTCNTIHSQ